LVVQRIIAVIQTTQEAVTATVVRIQAQIRIIHEAHLVRMGQVIRTTLVEIRMHQIQVVVAQVILAVVVQVLRDLVRAAAVQVTLVVHRVIIQAAAQAILAVHQAIVQEVVVQAILVVRQVRAQVREVVAVDLLPLIQEADKSSNNRIKKRASNTCSFLLVIDFI